MRMTSVGSRIDHFQPCDMPLSLVVMIRLRFNSETERYKWFAMRIRRRVLIRVESYMMITS
jgi:hypothetical protein